MGVFKITKKVLMVISLFVMLISINTYSQELTKEEFYKYTLEDAIDYSKDGNPIDVFLDFKKHNGGEVDLGYGDYVGLNGDAYYYELDEKVYEEENKIHEMIEKGEKEIVKELAINKNQNIKNYFGNNIIKVILLFICIISVIIGIVILKNKIVIIISSILIVVLVISLIIPSLFINTNKENILFDDIRDVNNQKIAIKNPFNSEEISQEIDENQESKVKFNNDFEYITEKEYIDKMCNKKYDISRYINDYILKVYYCVSKKAQDKEFDYEELSGILDSFNINKEKEYVSKLELLDRNTFLNNDPNDYGINTKTISFDEMKFIYENITDTDIEDYKNGTFIDKLINSIEQKIKFIISNDFDNQDLLLSRYLVKKINSHSLCKKFFDDDILRVLKDWYIEDNTKIELPFNVKLNFEKQKFIKKDINEFLAVNKDNYNLYVYYKDSKGNIKGDFVLSEYIDDNGNFNKSEITYNIKRAILTIDVDGFKPFYNYEDINVYDENGKYVLEKDVKEDIRDNMSYGTNRDNELEYILSTGNKNGFGFDITIDTYSFTQKFKNKFGTDYKIFQNFKVKKSKLIPIDKYIAKTDKLIRKLILEDSTEKICIFKVIWTDNYEVDDILTYIVPEDKMDLTYEEMYQLAFND